MPRSVSRKFKQEFANDVARELLDGVGEDLWQELVKLVEAGNNEIYPFSLPKLPG